LINPLKHNIAKVGVISEQELGNSATFQEHHFW